jgi:hypothetical protein
MIYFLAADIFTRAYLPNGNKFRFCCCYKINNLTSYYMQASPPSPPPPSTERLLLFPLTGTDWLTTQPREIQESHCGDLNAVVWWAPYPSLVSH